MCIYICARILFYPLPVDMVCRISACVSFLIESGYRKTAEAQMQISEHLVEPQLRKNGTGRDLEPGD